MNACLHSFISRSCNAPSVVWTCDACGAAFVSAARLEAADRVIEAARWFTGPLAAPTVYQHRALRDALAAIPPDDKE